jgi:hypothetical protein
MRVMTVAILREPAGPGDATVAFLESARFYTVPRAHAEFDRIVGELRVAAADRRPVRVQLAAEHGDVIEDVRAVTPDRGSA